MLTSTSKLNRGILLFSMITILLPGHLRLRAQSADLSTFRWTAVEAKGEEKVRARHENVFVEFKGKFYLIGGRGVNPVNVFDPETASWETRGKTPMEIHHFQPVVYGEAMYFVGAMTGGYPTETPLEHIWLYYPEKDLWEQGPEIPVSHQSGGAGAVLYDHKIYIACGIDYGHTSGTNNSFGYYDLKTGAWITLTKAPHIRDHFPAIVVDDKLYCVGGRNSSFHFKDNFGAFFNATVPWVDVYDFKEEKWYTMKEEVPYPSAAGGIVHMDGKLIYVGGEGSFKTAYNTTQSLDLKTGQWSQLSPMTTGRHGSSAILHQNRIYIAAGSPNRGGGNLRTIEVFSADHDWKKLFNGKDLEGWSVKSIEADRDKNFWSVEDGAIVCNSLSSEKHSHVWLLNEEEFGDFELRLKYQPSRKSMGNSGVQVRSRYDDQAKVKWGENIIYGWLDGPQVDINPGGPWRNGLIYDETTGNRRWINPSLENAGIDSATYAPEKVIQYYADEGPGWNDVSILCKGNRILTRINNVVVSDYDGSGILDDKVHKKRNVGQKGHIALQLHINSQNLIRYKDIEIRKLQ